MKRILSNRGPALFLAAALLVATALTTMAPYARWAAGAGPLLLAFALLGTDAFYRRRAGQELRPSSRSLLLAASLLVACGIVASTSLVLLAAMLPILGGSVVTPILLRHEGARPACRRA